MTPETASWASELIALTFMFLIFLAISYRGPGTRNGSTR